MMARLENAIIAIQNTRERFTNYGETNLEDIVSQLVEPGVRLGVVEESVLGEDSREG